MRVLVATVKPFAPQASKAMREIFDKAGYEVQFLEKYADESALHAAVSDVQALVVRSDKVDQKVLAEGSKLQIVVRAGAGYDNIDCDTAKAQGIVVENTPGQNSNAVAELAFGIMLSLARNNYDGSSGTELRGKRLGLHAFGYAARAVARIARGFGMEVSAFDPFISQDEMEKQGVECCSSAVELYQHSDYLSLHLPALPSTIGSIDEALLRQLPEVSTVINTARKEIIKEEDLLTIFAERSGFKYGADVAPSEEVKSKLLRQYGSRCFFTPKKMAAQTAEANINAACAAAQQIIAFFEKGDRTFQVNR